MGLNGKLSTMNMPDLLQFIETGRKTGVLKISRDQVLKQIYFRGGIIIGSSSNDPREYLGQFLLHYGKIEEADLNTGLAAQKETRLPLGQVLITSGMLEQSELLDVLRIQATEIVYDLFLWTVGNFDFEEGEGPPQGMIEIEIKPTGMLMEGVYRVDEWARYRTRIASDNCVLALVPGRSYKDVKPGSETHKLLWFIKKKMTMGEVIYNMHATPFHVYSQVFELVGSGLVRVLEEKKEEAAAEPEAPKKKKLSPEELLQQAAGHINNKEFGDAVLAISRALDLDPQHMEAQVLLRSVEAQYVQHFYNEVYPGKAVPRLAVSMDQLTGQQFGPKEGYILSRINGVWDIKSVLSVCPFAEATSLQIMENLISKGIIEINT